MRTFGAILFVSVVLHMILDLIFSELHYLLRIVLAGIILLAISLELWSYARGRCNKSS